jgi:hypothetical protein
MTNTNVTVYSSPYGIVGPVGATGSNADPTVDFAKESTLFSMYGAISSLNLAINGLIAQQAVTSIGGLTWSSKNRAY